MADTSFDTVEAAKVPGMYKRIAACGVGARFGKRALHESKRPGSFVRNDGEWRNAARMKPCPDDAAFGLGAPFLLSG
jgi:hypothetical protein